MPTMCDMRAAAGLDQAPRRRFVGRLRPLRLRDDRLHRRARVVEDLLRRDAGLHARHDGLVVVERELQQLALPGRVGAVHRPHAADVADVVAVVGRVVHQHEVAVLEAPRVAVVVHVVDVLGAGGGDRAIRFELRVVDQEDVARGGVELVLVDARFGAAHRFHQAEAGELRGAADQRDLARALDGAQVVEDRREIADLGAAALRSRSSSTNRLSRGSRPSHGSLAIAALPIRSSPRLCP